jgi:hypothetical protein
LNLGQGSFSLKTDLYGFMVIIFWWLIQKSFGICAQSFVEKLVISEELSRKLLGRMSRRICVKSA